MEVRKVVSKVVGVAQSGIGVLAIIFGYILYYNLFDIQGMLNVSAQNVPLCILLLFIFGLLSVISGLFLFYEQ